MGDDLDLEYRIVRSDSGASDCKFDNGALSLEKRQERNTKKLGMPLAPQYLVSTIWRPCGKRDLWSTPYNDNAKYTHSTKENLVYRFPIHEIWGAFFVFGG
jgi:hypothetical protein